MCIISVDDVLIGCTGCNSRYNPTRVCQGLPDSGIDVIKEYGGRGVKFSCTSCRWRREVIVMGHNLGGGTFRRHRLGAGQLGAVPFRRRFLIYFSNNEEKQ